METEHGDAVYGPPELSLRDYFAGCALTGLIADTSFNHLSKKYAEVAYELADAMLERGET